MKRLNVLDWIAVILIIIGGINWGLIGFFNFNLVQTIFNSVPGIARIIYAVVGLAAIWVIFFAAKLSKKA